MAWLLSPTVAPRYILVLHIHCSRGGLLGCNTGAHRVMMSRVELLDGRVMLDSHFCANCARKLLPAGLDSSTGSEVLHP